MADDAHLGSLQQSVLDALWDAPGPLSVREVLGRVQRRPKLAYTTVMTVLDRLHDRSLVMREKRGRAYYYRPRVSREEWLGRQAARVLTADRAVLMAFLDSAERADPALLSELSELLAARRGGRR